MKDSKSGCITKVPRRRQLAYGGARNLNTAWIGLRLTEVSRSRHMGFRISKASCVGGTALLHFVGSWILASSKNIKNFPMSPGLKSTGNKLEVFGRYARGRHRSGFIWHFTNVSERFLYGGVSFFIEHASHVDQDGGRLRICTVLVMLRP